MQPQANLYNQFICFLLKLNAIFHTEVQFDNSARTFWYKKIPKVKGSYDTPGKKV